MLSQRGRWTHLEDIPSEVLIERVQELSPREQEILALLASELSNQCIASHTGIALGTVKQHISNIIRKFLKPLVSDMHSYSKRMALAMLFRRYQLELQGSLAAELESLHALRACHETALADTNRRIKEIVAIGSSRRRNTDESL